jgi:sugar phosphate isomerase/epimerase
LRALPAEKVVSVQLGDVQAEPMSPLRLESLHHRLPRGNGHGDVRGMLRALAEHAVRPRLVSVEVIPDALIADGIDVAAHTAFESAHEVLAAAPIELAD